MNNTFTYQMLGRLQSDCEYVIHTTHCTRHLWGMTVNIHITEMKRLYNSLEVKPEWLCPADIAYYEKELRSLGI